MKDLAGRFAEAERRVQELAGENRKLRAHLKSLEKELLSARACTKELEALREKRTQVRSRLERILHTLESLDLKDKRPDIESATDPEGP